MRAEDEDVRVSGEWRIQRPWGWKRTTGTTSQEDLGSTPGSTSKQVGPGQVISLLGHLLRHLQKVLFISQ